MGRYAASQIGKQLSDARSARGLSVIQAAEVLKVKRQMVYNYEKGRCLPAIDVLLRAASAWNVPFELGGRKVFTEEIGAKKEKKAEPIQQVFPFNRRRHYKKASVKITQHNHEMVITAIIRNTAI